MGGSDGCRYDALLIVVEYQNWRFVLEGFQALRRCVLGGFKAPIWLCPGRSGTTITGAISSSSASNNKPRLAYIWMYVCWDVHQDTYLDIWVRRVIIIKDANCGSVVRFVEFASNRFYIGFLVLWLLYYTCSRPVLLLVFYFSSLLFLSYHTKSTSCLISLIWYLCAYPCSPPGFRITTRLGSSDSSGSSCPGLGAWTEGDFSCWGPSLLLRSGQTSCSSSHILAPPLLARGPSSYLVSALLYCSYMYISLYSRICAYRWCNIIVIFITSGDNFVIVLICWNV